MCKTPFYSKDQGILTKKPNQPNSQKPDPDEADRQDIEEGISKGLSIPQDIDKKQRDRPKHGMKREGGGKIQAKNRQPGAGHPAAGTRDGKEPLPKATEASQIGQQDQQPQKGKSDQFDFQILDFHLCSSFPGKRKPREDHGASFGLFQSFSGTPLASLLMEPQRIITPSIRPQMAVTVAPIPQVNKVIRSWATAFPV